MTTQLSIFDEAMRHDPYASLWDEADPKLVTKFLEYHRYNPELYRLFQRFALEARNAQNRSRFSIWMIANRVRWYSTVETTGMEFKVSNDYLALYARILVIDFPELSGLFQFKAMKKVRVGARE